MSFFISNAWFADEFYLTNKGYQCDKCQKMYKRRKGLAQHQKYECGKEPQFGCSYCVFKTKRKENLKQHMVKKHTVILI